MYTALAIVLIVLMASLFAAASACSRPDEGAEEAFMEEALKEAYAGIRAGDGGPFGCVIVKDKRIIGRGHNRVLLKQDPTCHGEMEAIRDACEKTGSFDLQGCALYTTAEPCPMCLGAIMWANIREVYYGCNRTDTDGIGFRDEVFYKHLNGEADVLSMEELGRGKCLALFAEYKALDKKTGY